MSCEIHNGNEVAYCEQPLADGKYRMVRFVVNHGAPVGNYRMELLQEDILGRPHGTGESRLVPVDLVPDGEKSFPYRDEKHQQFVAKYWVEIFVAGQP